MIPQDCVGDGDWVLSEDMDSEGDYRLIQLKHIGFGEYVEKPYQRVNQSFVEEHHCSLISQGDILINRLVNEKMSVCICPKHDWDSITSVDVCWIKPNQKYNQKYLMFALMCPSFQNQILMLCSGSTRKRVSKTNLLNQKVPIHSDDKQSQVVDFIEKTNSLLYSIAP